MPCVRLLTRTSLSSAPTCVTVRNAGRAPSGRPRRAPAPESSGGTPNQPAPRAKLYEGSSGAKYCTAEYDQ